MVAQSICKIDGCGKARKARGWCDGHYYRWSKHGHPLSGGPPVAPAGEPERFYREVVLTCERGPNDPCLIWPYAQYGDGYAHIVLDGKHRSVSRLICKERHGPPPSPQHEAAHSCGNGHLACVTKGHMDWKTRSQNQADRLVHGTHMRGDRNPLAKITEAKVRQIRSLEGTMSQREIAALVGISPTTVNEVLRRKKWGWLP